MSVLLRELVHVFCELLCPPGQKVAFGWMTMSPFAWKSVAM